MANRVVGSITGRTDYATKAFTVANGVTITAGDFVYFSGGYLTNSSVAGKRLIGMAAETIVGDGTKKALVYVEPDLIFVVDNDNDSTTFAATHVGTYFDLTGATGAQLVDTSTTTANGAQLLAVEYNPKIQGLDSDTSQGLFVIAEHALYPFNAAS